MSAKLEKRMDEMQATTRRLQDEVYSVHKDSARISSLQEEQTTLVRSFADTLHRDVSWVHACVCVCVCVSRVVKNVRSNSAVIKFNSVTRARKPLQRRPCAIYCLMWCLYFVVVVFTGQSHVCQRKFSVFTLSFKRTIQFLN